MVTKKIVFTARGTKDSKKVAETLMGAGAADKTFLYAGLQQAVENGVDAGCKCIYIHVDKGNNQFWIGDDGSGFLEKNVNGFFSLMVSPKVDAYGKSLKAGQIGRNGSGRYFLLHFCKSIKVFTKSKDFTKVVTFTLSQGDVEELISSEYIDRPVHTGEKPPMGWNFGKTGSYVILEGIPKKLTRRIPSPDKIRKEFARQLKPSIAAMVRVNDEKLEPRKVLGDIIDRSFESVPGLPGKNSIYLFIPEKRQSGEEVGLGAINNVTTLKEVIKQLPPELKEMVPSELRHGRILGDIYIPALNEFRSHDARSFKDELFDSPVLDALLSFLNGEVRKVVTETFDERRAAAEKEAQRALMDSLCSSFRNLNPLNNQDLKNLGVEQGTGPGKKKQAGKGGSGLDLEVFPGSLTCLPGHTETFRLVGKSKLDPGEAKWEVVSGGGKVSKKQAASVMYTAPAKPGGYIITVRNAKPGKSSIFRSIKVKVVSDLVLKISPVKVQVIQGDSHWFRVRNVHLTSSQDPAKIRWSVQSVIGKKTIKGVTLSSNTGDKVKVNIGKNVSKGHFVIIAEDADEPKEHHAESTFEVIEPPQEVGDFIKMDGTIYELLISKVKQDMSVQLGEPRLSLTNPSAPLVPTLRIDVHHDLLKDFPVGSPIFVHNVIPDLIMSHLQSRFDNGEEPTLGDPGAMRQRLTEIRMELSNAGRKAKEKKN